MAKQPWESPESREPSPKLRVQFIDIESLYSHSFELLFLEKDCILPESSCPLSLFLSISLACLFDMEEVFVFFISDWDR